MPRVPGDNDGVFRGVARRGVVTAKARRKLLVGFAVLAVTLAVASRTTPEATVVAVQVAIPVMYLGFGAGAVIFAGRAVSRLVTGKYRSGRTDFGLPRARAESRDRLRPRS